MQLHIDHHDLDKKILADLKRNGVKLQMLIERHKYSYLSIKESLVLIQPFLQQLLH